MQEDKDEDRRNTGESEDKDESVYSIGDTAKFIVDMLIVRGSIPV